MIRLRKQGLSETSSTCSGIRTLLDGSGGAPLVSVMQPAQHRYRDDPARLRRLDRSGLRRILLQCQVNAVAMIIVHEPEARSLPLLHLRKKDCSETGADQGAYIGQEQAPGALVVLIFPVLTLTISRKFSHCNKPLLLFVCFTGDCPNENLCPPVNA